MTDPIIRTRFAPSPSGHLHVGGARTALYCWAYAKARGGRFILRIEDTDQKRSSAAASMGFLEDLDWLGIPWDEGPEHGSCGGGEAGPYFQAQRLEIYNQYIDQLIGAGLAYRAFETSEELTAERDRARAEKRDYRYNRASLEYSPEQVEQFLADGRPHVVRLKVPDDREVVVEDEVLGEVRIAPGGIDDFIIRKDDGFPTYHFAVVVDDQLMGVTHVIRGQEHLNNTPRHVLLQDALGFRRPTYAHISLIFNPGGSKMSKRDKDKVLRAAIKERGITSCEEVDDAIFEEWLGSKDRQLDSDVTTRIAGRLEVALPEINVDDFRRGGFLPDVLINYLALLGWSPGDDIEKFDREFLLERFDLDRIVKSPARFDRDKLLAFNLDAIQAMEDDAFAAAMREYCERYAPEFIEGLDDAQFAILASANKSRSKTLGDALPSSRFLIQADEEITVTPSKAVRKALVKGEVPGFDHLAAIRPILAELSSWTAPALEERVGAYAEEHADGKLGKVAQPLRIAVTGTTVSPSIFESLAILGQDSVLRRIDRCLAQREELAGEAGG